MSNVARKPRNKLTFELLKDSGSEGLTMLEVAILLSKRLGVTVLPSDLTGVFSRYTNDGVFLKTGNKRDNPKLAGKRIARSAEIYITNKTRGYN